MDYSILRYGAVADGVTNCAAAIQQAVDAAAAAGGGRVIVPAGRFLSGSVLLKDNVELHLESGAVLISSLNPADITPFPQGGDGTDPDDTADGWEGGFFLGASHAKNVTISGMGTIYGQGDKVFLDKNVDNGFHECPKFCEAFRCQFVVLHAGRLDDKQALLAVNARDIAPGVGYKSSAGQFHVGFINLLL